RIMYFIKKYSFPQQNSTAKNPLRQNHILTRRSVAINTESSPNTEKIYVPGGREETSIFSFDRPDSIFIPVRVDISNLLSAEIFPSISISCSLTGLGNKIKLTLLSDTATPVTTPGSFSS